MARTPSIFNNPMTGNLGNQTFKDYSGTQVVTSRFRTTSATGAGASYAQRLVRLELPNIVLAGSQLKQYLPCLFEKNKYYATPYTHFISHNKNAVLPCQPKYDVEKKYCHWGKLVVACGSLPYIPLSIDKNWAASDIVADSAIVQSSTSVGTLSSYLMRSSYQFLEGDFIFFIVCTTSAHQDSTTGQMVYISTPRFGYFQIDPNSNVVLDNVPTLSEVLIGTVSPSPGSYRVSVGCPQTGSAAMVHIRKIGNRYLSSPATMVLNNNAATYEQAATSQDWVDMCAQTYGYKPDIL